MAFSNRDKVGWLALFYEAEMAELEQPLVPLFDPQGASNGYAVAVTDPDLLYRQRLAQGLQGAGTLRIAAPKAGTYGIWARVRATGQHAHGRFSVAVNGKSVGGFTVEGIEWHWLKLDRGTTDLPAGTSELRLATSCVGLAVDLFALSNDPSFEPRGKGNAPATPPTVPRELQTVTGEALGQLAAPQALGQLPDIAQPHAVLAWQPAAAPQGVRYYNVHRSLRPDAPTSQTTLVGSVTEPAFVDGGLSAQTYYYRVVAVDSWGNASGPSDALTVTVKAP